MLGRGLLQKVKRAQTAVETAALGAAHAVFRAAAVPSWGRSTILLVPRRIRRAELEELTSKTRLSPAEVRALYARFRRLAPTGHLLPDEFKQSMGVLGFTEDSFLPDRMFQVFDLNQDGKLSFFEFASALAVMIRGTEDEKLQLSFEMATGGKGALGLTLEDFQRLVGACKAMASSLAAPPQSPVSGEDVARLFHDLASVGAKDGEVITLEAYKRAARASDAFLRCLGLGPQPGRGSRGTCGPAMPPSAETSPREQRGKAVPPRKAAARQRRCAASPRGGGPPGRTGAFCGGRWPPTCGCIPWERTWCLPLASREASYDIDEEPLATRQELADYDFGQRPSQSSRTTSGNSVVMTTSSSWQRKRHRLLGPKKGLAVHFGHESWNMVLSMMTGIRLSVVRSKHEAARELVPQDFMMKEKFSIVPRLTNIFDSNLPKRTTMIRFMDHAPMVFQKIRASFGILHDDYLRSVGPEQLLGNMVLGNLSSLSELSSEGKSGAFFYYTADGKYMMKTVTSKEHKLLRGMLRCYYDYVTQNPGTLIVRFLGLHSIRVHKLRRVTKFLSQSSHASKELYFVVMGNMFNANFDIHRRYDLKGSWVGRMRPPDKLDPSVALLDVDFKQANERIRVGDRHREMLVEQIERDSRFLRDNDIIDYSLLLGIHDVGAGPGTVPAAGDAAADPGGGTRHDSGQPLKSSAACAASKRQGSSLPGPTSPAGCLGPLPSPLSSASSPAARWPGQGHYRAERVEALVHQRNLGGLLSSDGKSIYFLGIIDVLTPYDQRKRLEHTVKSLWYDGRGVSCCPPGLYAERFAEFMRAALV